eukprot:771575-Rhodomonas_salina.3
MQQPFADAPHPWSTRMNSVTYNFDIFVPARLVKVGYSTTSLSWLKAKGNNSQQERLAAILYSCRVQDLLDGTLDVAKWAECPWLW